MKKALLFFIFSVVVFWFAGYAHGFEVHDTLCAGGSGDRSAICLNID
jgi:hypothetical protein